LSIRLLINMESQAEPLIPQVVSPSSQPEAPAKANKIPWIPLAAASGACAAFNGVFAKLFVDSTAISMTDANSCQHDD